MPVRIECDLRTGITYILPLTQAEIDAAALSKAIEDTYNAIDLRAARAIDSVNLLQFELLFDHENRIRILEGKTAITRTVYRNALIAQWKLLNP